VLEQSACDDPGMDKIMVCAGFSPRTTSRRPTWPARSDGNGEAGAGDDGKDHPDRPYLAVPGLRRSVESWITKY